MIKRINKKGQKTTLRTLVEISPKVGRYKDYNCKKIWGKYYIEIFVEYSIDKQKRRKANKIAKKQRKINKKN
jgi:hypothetical protein